MSRKEKITRVIDGDTFITGSRKKPVRLVNVNAPEKESRDAGAATQALRNLVEGQTVSIDIVVRNKYGRCVVNVKISNRSINAAMRRKGYK